jgi:hypothetical protein
LGDEESSRTCPWSKQLPKDIWLRFYPGAKTGIVGSMARANHPDGDHGGMESGHTGEIAKHRYRAIASRLSLFALALYGIPLLSAVSAMADSAIDCHVGAYRLVDGAALDIAPSDGDTLRWRLLTGETGALHKQANGTWTSSYGWTDRPDGKTVSFSACDRGEIKFGAQSGRRIPFDVTNTILRVGV